MALQAEMKAATAAAAKPKIRPMEAASRRKKKEEKPKIQLTEEKKRKCYMWYARLGQPNRAQMIHAVVQLPKSCDITVEDVEALPWIMGGALLPVKEMNELFMYG